MKTNETPISNTDLEPQSDSRFNTILAASYRARELSKGHLPLVNTKSVTNTVKALEEIAAGKVNVAEYVAKLQPKKGK